MAEQGQAELEQPTEASIVERITRVLQPEEPEAETPEGESDQPEETKAEEETPEGTEVDPDEAFIPVTVKTEGGADEEETVSINQLRAGYMRQKDYQRKTAELARSRESQQSEIEQQISQQRQQYIEGLQVAEQALQQMVLPELMGVDIERLAREKPGEAIALQARGNKLRDTINNIRGQIQQAQQRAFAEAAAKSKQALSDPVSGLPGWGDQMYTQIINEGSKLYGFSPEEVASVVDHRMIRVLHDAMQFKQASQAKPKEQPAKPAPKVLKPGAPQGKSELRAKEVAHLNQRLQKSGSIEDAAALYLARKRNG